MNSPAGKTPALWSLTQKFARDVDKLRFAAPVAYVYNPLIYAGEAHRLYLERYGQGPKEAIFLGMNPGPFGMAQTGVPFGEVRAVRDWMKIEANIGKPRHEHPKRPVTGFECARSEVSGARLWGLFADCYGSAKEFFSRFLVLNYCPLVFMEQSGRNLTPDKLPSLEREALFEICDATLKSQLAILKAPTLIGVGAFAEQRLRAISPPGARVERILHPSPASPLANKNWAGTVAKQLRTWDLLS